MSVQTKLSKSDLSFESSILSPSIGLEIFDLRLDHPLKKGVLGELKDALLQYHLLVIRDQNLTPEQQIEFAQQMGEPNIYPFVQGIKSYPFITPVIKEAHETQNFGGIWHTDTAYLKRPPSATILLARETPPEGGDTIFFQSDYCLRISVRWDENSSGLPSWIQYVRKGKPGSNQCV
tara:strand:+ start:162 stop:692 length:531 start_codon:yes stop_codon:yes gene_type:complete